MTQTIQKRTALRLSTLLLMFALLLSGCSSSSGSSSSGDQSGSAASETTDFRKYNAYSDVVSDVYEMDGLLAAYFTVVKDQPDFALMDGMDYSMLADAFSDYMPIKSVIETAVGYSDEEPLYPDQDSLLLALEQPYTDMQDILQDLSVYLTYQDYLEDDLAQAAELHTKLYEAVGPFDAAAQPFVDAMDVLDQQTEQQELDRLKGEGMDIAFYSRTLLNLCNEMDAEVWAQLENAETLPVLDMTNLDPLYTQYQEAYAGLTQALNDPDQVAKVTNWNDGSYWSDTYHNDFTSAVDVLNTAITAFMDAAKSQSDYGQSYDQFYEAVSDMIDQYNASIV